MSSVNKVILLGTLGRDPEVRSLPNGRVANLSVATSERWKDAAGERQERTEWHRVAIFNERLVDVVERFLTKGRQVYLEGQLQTRKWVDPEGHDRYSTEVVLSKFRGELVLVGGAPGGAGAAADAGTAAQRPESRARTVVGERHDAPERHPSARQVSTAIEAARGPRVGTVEDQLSDEIPF